MSKTARMDLKSKGDVLKIHELCRKDGCKCQKKICFTPKQFEREGDAFKNTMKKFLREVKKHGIHFLSQQ